MHENTTARVEAFSDGVFGIALTLLILDFKVPHLGDQSAVTSRQLARELLQMWPTIIAFVLSFGTVLTMWVNHHGLFRHAHRTDNRLLFANGLLLLVVTFVPFPTAVLADYLNQPAANAAAAFYCGTFIVINAGSGVNPTSIPVSGDITINGIQAATATSLSSTLSTVDPTGVTLVVQYATGIRGNPGPITGLRVFTGTGTFTGTASLYVGP